MRVELFRYLWVAAACSYSFTAAALPLGFGRNQGDIQYGEYISPNFHLYHDAEAPVEGAMMIRSLETARPTMESWIGAKREGALPVVMSAKTSNASFANFILDAVEIQSMGQGDRDLAWHEYTHSTMYRHLDNWFGPAGSVIHLPWMPAWWIEGLAEALSVSVGSDFQMGVERYHAFSGQWPSYDKLHALYNKANFTIQGYATAGAFVRYLLYKYDANKLPQVLNDFYRYSMPWYWPEAMWFWNDFMPMDEALQRWTGKIGRQLYDEYKLAATQYWRDSVKQPFRQASKAARSRFQTTSGVQARNGKLYHILNQDGDVGEVELTRTAEQPWINGWKLYQDFPDEIYTARLVQPQFKAFVTGQLDNDYHQTNTINIQKTGVATAQPLVETPFYVIRIMQTPKYLLWYEELEEQYRICRTPLARALSGVKLKAEDIECPFLIRAPDRLFFLGQQDTTQADGTQLTNLAWFRQTTETVKGDRHQLLRYDLNSENIDLFSMHDAAKPLTLIPHGNGWLVLAADHNSRFLRLLNKDLGCEKEFSLADHILNVWPLPNDEVALSLFGGTRESIYIDELSKMPSRACESVRAQDSPLLAAMNQEKAINLAEAMQQSSPWRKREPDEVKQYVSHLQQTPNTYEQPTAMTVQHHEKAQYRARPLFAFPWIGADAMGSQLGFVSLPLVDELQNDQIRLNMLFGIESRFPQTDISYTTTRYLTTWQLNAFRQQTFNGAIGNNSLYYDERGAQLSATRPLPEQSMVLEGGWRSSTLKPIIGPSNFRRASNQNELSLAVSKSQSFRHFSLSHSIASSVAPAALNKIWDYNKLGVSTGITIPIDLGNWRTTQLSLGVQGSRTRGKMMKYLKEVYRPLKTFVPGTGGGFNEINVGLVGPGALTGGRYGDTQARFRSSWTLPLVEDLEKLVGIFYFQRLDFTAFYNYGGAWYGSQPKTKNLIAAHGYNIDLQTDIKGVTVNGGLGIGQVVGYDYELYFLFGFDALIN